MLSCAEISDMEGSYLIRLQFLAVCKGTHLFKDIVYKF